jgi:hypothetical protein
MGGDSSDPKIKVTPKEDGAVITVDGFDIIITIKPSEEIPIELPVLIKPSLTVELVKKDLDLYLEDIDITERATYTYIHTLYTHTSFKLKRKLARAH